MARKIRLSNILVLTSMVATLSLSVSSGRVIYVDDDAPGANNGSSWFNAYRYLQDALAVAAPGDEIRVGQGTYKPNLSSIIPVPPDRFASFVLRPNVVLLGGFAGYGPSPSWPSDDRDPTVYKTILSGDRSGNDWTLNPADHTAVGLLLTDSTRQDNCYNVVTATSVDSTCVLDGFVIIGGIANGTTAKRGGGIICTNASPTIRNCTIMGCAAAERGGAMYLNNSRPDMTSCTIAGNYASQRGGAMYNLIAEPNILQCTFANNLVAQQGKGGAIANEDSNAVVTSSLFQKNYGGSEGGAIHNLRSRPAIINCTFIENTTRLTGGAIENSNGSLATITRCSFIGNTTGQAGGAICNWAGSTRMLHCILVGNRSNDEAGAVYVNNSEPNIVNCLFNGNTATTYGGAISCSASTLTVINCTFSANTAVGGRAIACSSTSPPETASRLTVANSILWDGGSEIYNNDGSSIKVTYSDVQSWLPGTGNISGNPLFTDRDGPDNILGNQDDVLTLSTGSPCIDAGDNTILPIDLLSDLAGKARRHDDPATPDSGKGQRPIVDMGVYEFGSPAPGQNPPVANAGPDRTVTAGVDGYATVQLDGSGSYDPEGSPITYLWSWTIGTQTYTASGIRPTIQLPIGVHNIQLVVFDGTLYSSPDTVRITVQAAANQPPVANAGPDRTFTAGVDGYATVQLDGSGSYDPEGSPITYLWSWTIGTQTYTASGVRPTIQLPVGVHTIRLRVHDGTQYSPEDTVVITVRAAVVNQPPVAHAGPDRTVTAGAGGYATVQLDGSGSYDPEGSPITYLWSWTIGTQTYTASGVRPTIQLPVGVHTIRLRVHDGTQYSPEDTVVITVQAIPQYQMWLWPFQVRRTDTVRYVVAIIRLPEIGLLDLDMTAPLTIWPYGIEAISQDATEYSDGPVTTVVYAIFWEDDLLDAIPQDGLVDLTVQGQMASGQPYQATGQVVLSH